MEGSCEYGHETFGLHKLLRISRAPELLVASQEVFRYVELVQLFCFWTYPSSCLYLKTPSFLFFKTQRFGGWILSPSSGKTYSVGPNR
jgi:hypothetical protein